MSQNHKTVFVSYAEEDAATARRVGSIIRDAGLQAWLYQNDVLPGKEYIEAVSEALDAAGAIVVIISKHSAVSQHVRNEVVHALEDKKPIIPLLKGLTHQQLIQKQPVWRTILGARVTYPIPRGGPDAISDRIVGALTGEAPRTEMPVSRRRTGIVALAVLVVALGVTAWFAINRTTREPAATTEAPDFQPVSVADARLSVDRAVQAVEVGRFEEGETIATETIVRIRQGLPLDAGELVPYKQELAELFETRARSFVGRSTREYARAIADQRRSCDLSPSAKRTYDLALYFHEWGEPDSARHYVDVARLRYPDSDTPLLLREYQEDHR